MLVYKDFEGLGAIELKWMDWIKLSNKIKITIWTEYESTYDILPDDLCIVDAWGFVNLVKEYSWIGRPL